MPLAALGCGAVCGARHGVAPLLVLTTALLFAPSRGLFYDLSAWVYLPVYAGLTALGNGLGALLRRAHKEPEKPSET